MKNISFMRMALKGCKIKPFLGMDLWIFGKEIYNM